MDTHISLVAASRLLNLSIEEIRKLVKKGLLPSIKIQDDIYVSRHDVHLIREMVDNEETLLTPEEKVITLSMRIKWLEDKIDRICTFLEMGTSISLANLTDKQMYALYHEACDLLTHDTWDIATIYKWCSVFINITSDQFKRLSLLTKNKHPWKIMADLNKVLRDWWVKEGLVKTQIQGLEAAYLLDKGYKNLKKEALFYEDHVGDYPHIATIKYFLLPRADKIRIFLDLIK